MHILFIINPVAGAGKIREHWSTIKSKILDNFKNVEFTFTKKPNDATVIAYNAAKQGFDTIVVCGGDGTLNEVVNGLMGKRLDLTILPVGTGSDFGRTIGIKRVEDTISALSTGNKVKVDVGVVLFHELNKIRYFINIMEVGFGAQVMQYVNTHKKTKHSFFKGILSTLPKLSKFEMNVSFNTSTRRYTTFEIIIANGQYFGGGMLASPQSKIDDGMMELHILKPFSKLFTILRLKTLSNGTYIEKGYSYDYTINNVNLYNKGALIEVDGEVVGTTPVSVTIKKAAISFIVP